MVSNDLKCFLRENNQEHLDAFFEQLDGDGQAELEREVRSVDFSMLNVAQEEHGRGIVSPIYCQSIADRAPEKDSNVAAGIAAAKNGTVAAVMLAGGQGTRLGFSSPKGCYDVGITHHLYLFEIHINKLLEFRKRHNAEIPLYIMTGEKNNAETIEFFEEHNYFGYGKNNIGFFCQESSPCTDMDGRLLMETRGRLASSPNGNGRWFSSLMKSSCGENVRRRNIKWISLFGVDNPLQRFCDEEFMGAAIRSGSDCTVKVVRKAYPEEQMSVLCLEDGNVSMIAYYEMSDELRYARDSKGELLYSYGDILNSFFSVKSLEECLNCSMPVHIAKKKIPYMDVNGIYHKPEEANGYKYEFFLFDVLPYMKSVSLFEVEREKEFAPIKNLTGIDSVESARKLLVKNGVKL